MQAQTKSICCNASAVINKNSKGGKVMKLVINFQDLGVKIL
jgi:hypothetical protein